MAKQIINIGTSPNSGTGDPLRTAFTKINQNFVDTEFSHLELTNTEVAFVGTEYYFVKTDYGSEVDYIDEGLALTRANAQGIFNIIEEQEYDRDNHTSPANTEWNADGWSNLVNVTNRTYTTWRESLDTNIAAIVGQELIMHDLINDKYWGIMFTQWTQGIDPGGEQGGGFAYTRQLIDVDAGKGITFPDGSIQRKAANDIADLSDNQKLLNGPKNWFNPGTNEIWTIVDRTGGIRISTNEPIVEDINTVSATTVEDSYQVRVPRDGGEASNRIQEYWDGNIEGGYDYTRIVIANTEYEGFVTTYNSTEWILQVDGGPVSVNTGDPVTVRYYGNPISVKWFDAADYPNANNFLSAKVDYYAYVENRGQQTGTIWFTASHDQYGNFETSIEYETSGNDTDLEMDIRPDSQLPYTSLWLSTNSANSEPVSIMWDAKMFYGANSKIIPEIIPD
jgi:hypothetical protein